MCTQQNLECLKQNKNHQATQARHSMLKQLFLICFLFSYIFPRVINRQVLKSDMLI